MSSAERGSSTDQKNVASSRRRHDEHEDAMRKRP